MIARADLPAWAASMAPVDMAGAAALLGISKRTLVDVLKVHQHYERRGVRKVFYPEHIEALREGLKQCRDSLSKSGAASFTPLDPLPASAFDKALALATRPLPKNSRPSSRRASGNVVPMANDPDDKESA